MMVQSCKIHICHLLIQFDNNIQMNNQQRRVLPPGVDDDIVFGILWIKVGTIKAVRPTALPHKVDIQFWGQQTPFTAYTSLQNPPAIQYDVKCPITFFQKYLIDMNKNLKIQVQNLGMVVLDLTKYLKKNINLHCKTPFDHFKGFFQVIGKYGKKTAALEMEFCANFNPQIALRELEQQQQIPVCPAEKILNSPIKQANKIEQLPIQSKQNNKKIEKPQLFEQFYEQSKRLSPKVQTPSISIQDNRIANSLNNSPNTGKFDQKRYIQKQIITPSLNKVFPAVQKILTYSNLRLQKEISINDKIQQKIIQINDKYINSDKMAQIKATPTSGKTNLNIENQKKKEKSIKSSKQLKSQQSMNKPQKKQRSKSKDKPLQQIIPSKKQVIKQIPKIKETKQQIQHDFYLMNRQINVNQMSDVEKVDESMSVDAQKQILSRVVNLNEELQKQKVNSPKKHPLKETDQQKYHTEANLKCFQLPVHLFTNNYHQMQPSKRKTSNLLLNIVIQVNTQSVKLNKNIKFTLSYRPYGQKENIKAGPQLSPNFLIMFPVGELQVLKMNKIPFILEFWGANDGQLLGLLKLSFANIHKGFVLQGRLNELAVKTNIVPTTIFKGNHDLLNLTQKKVGQCFITAHIGTTSQIHSYLNSLRNQSLKPQQPPKQNNIIDKPPQNKEKPIQIKQIRKKGTLVDFTSFLKDIDSNKNLTIQHLIKFINLKQSNFQQLQILLTKLQFKGGNFFPILEQNGSFQCKQLSFCFQDYKKIKQKINKKMMKIILNLQKQQKNNLIQKIKQKSNFGILSNSGLKQTLKDNKLNLILKALSPTIQTQQLILWIQNADKYILKNITINQQQQQILKIFQQFFFQQCHNPTKIIQSILQNKNNKNNNTNQMSLYEIKLYFINKNNKSLSLWFWIYFKILIYKEFQENNINQKYINIALLYNWIVRKQKQYKIIKLQNNNNNIYEKQTINFKQKIDDLSKQEEDDNDKYEGKSGDELNKQSIQIINLNHNKKKAQKQHNNSQQNKQFNGKKVEEKIIQHKFIVEIEELHVQEGFNAQCIVFYKFPYEEDQISSRKLQLHGNKHKYKIQCTGTHKFTLSQPIQQYLGQSTVKFRVNIGKDELYGDLHSQQLIANGTQFRIIPLFSLKGEGIIGKLKMRVSYDKRLTSELLLGKQTIRDVFLPKNGYLNFELSTNVDQKKIRQQLNIKQEFYLQMSIDIFGQNQSLAPHFPPFNSKLYSDFSSPFIIHGSFKISLSPQILMHLKSGNCNAKLFMIYYAKQHGHYQRKELVVANFKAPMLSVIKQQGLKGDYAFKNKLGMFVSLASCSIKYQKQPKNQIDAQHNFGDPSRESYWLMISLLEVLNYEGDLGWIKFQIVYQGKRYSTEQQIIRENGFYDLQNKVLCIHMGSQEFTSTKIIAVNIITAHQHFGLDINLRPIAKMLAKQKYFCDHNYFITLDDQSKLRKLRIGAKVYAFRGSSTLNHFVEAIQKNSYKQDEEYILKEDHYHQNLQKLRKKLKLSSKTYQEILSALLDKRKKQRLSSQFFNMKFYPNLDLTPILTFKQQDVDLLLDQLASSVSQQQFLQYLQQSGIKFINLRAQFLQRYSYNTLNYNKLDQNVQYLGLHKEVDTIVFARKVRFQQINKNQTFLQKQKQKHKNKHVRISIIRGYNFHFLYNGIKPNAIIKIPDVGLQTQIIQRSSQPIFNQHMNFQIQGNQLKKFKIQVYHGSGEQIEDILIGEGILSIVQNLNNKQIPNSKLYKIILSSTMSNKMKATLDIKVQISEGKQMIEQQRNDSYMQQSINDSMIQEAMNKMNNIGDYRKKVQLFQSSDQD